MESLLKILDLNELDNINSPLKEVVEYRKSGLSLNHVIGCPLDCSYCVRHLFDNFDQKIPHALMTDEEAVKELTTHQFFQPHITPLQIFNRATDPLLPRVKHHTFNTLRLLDEAGLNNNVLLITRWKVTKSDCDQLNSFRNIKLTILITYSGIEDSKLEPVKSSIAESSLKTLYRHAQTYKVLLYWRPIIPGVNDSEKHIEKAYSLAKSAHATVFSGLFYRNEIAEYYRSNGLIEPYIETARRKILPEISEEKIIRSFTRKGSVNAIFRKTSCAVAYARRQPDYNGHYGINELCDICPNEQVVICQQAWKKPDYDMVAALTERLGATDKPFITDQSILVRGLDEQHRYFIQHSLGYQVHDVDKPHHYKRHGRADTGWK